MKNKAILRQMIDLDLNQRELARISGMDAGRISMTINRKYRPTAEEWERIARALDAPVEELRGDE